MPAVRLPANVELEDRLAFGLTGRQLALLAASAVAAYAAEALLAALLPLPLALGGAVLTAAAGLAVALTRRDGLRGEELALALTRFALSPRRLVLAPDGLPAPFPGRHPAPAQRRAAALEPPVSRILASGLVELADGSHCLLLRARGTSFALRDGGEQAAFVAAFARFLNGLAAPVQIHVARERASLEAHARELEQRAGSLGAELAAAAADHARYLRSLGEGEAPLSRRRILLVLRSRERDGELAQAALRRSAQQAAELLQGAGVTLAPLAGEEAAALLARSLGAAEPLPPGSRLEGVIGARAAHAS
jgi:hypothetical protein